MGWIDVEDALPEKRGEYLVTRKYLFFSGIPQVSILEFVPNLEELDDIEFAGKNHSGWCTFDPEYGYREESGVIAWRPKPKPYCRLKKHT